MRKFFLFLLILQTIHVFPQRFSLPYKLNEDFPFDSLLQNKDVSGIDEIILLDERNIEFAYTTDQELVEFTHVHSIIYVNSQEAIDRQNKIYINLSRALELVDYDACVVSPSGVRKCLGSDALKKGEDDEGNKYTYFAISGIEKGGFIEYFYLIKKNPKITGNYQIFQGNEPVSRAVFRIISPQNLIFKTKSYNGFSDVMADSSLPDKNMWVAETYDIPKIIPEDFANEDANKMMVLYKLDGNKYAGSKNIYNFDIAGQLVFSMFYEPPTKTASKEIQSILKLPEVKNAPNTREKILALENHVKKAFTIIENSDPMYQDWDVMCKSKIAGESGISKFFYHLLKAAGIKAEIVTTTNRFDIKFDPSNDNWIYLIDFLFYIPELDDYMMPSEHTSRVGLIPYVYIENYGLFVNMEPTFETRSEAIKVKFIKAYPDSVSSDLLTINARLNPSLDSLEADIELIFSGYYAQVFQPVFDYIEKNKIREYQEEILKNIHPSLHVKNVSAENPGIVNLMKKPLIVRGNISSVGFVERAGPNILLKVGELIGPQVEMYQVGKRQFPVENDYNRLYIRNLKITIPDGYTCSNFEALNMDITPFKDRGDMFGFTSTYSTENNIIHVKVTEYYRQITLPVEDFEAYRSVVNAAANFNKIVLIFEKNQ